jgi:hypothetical protein
LSPSAGLAVNCLRAVLDNTLRTATVILTNKRGFPWRDVWRWTTQCLRSGSGR